MKTHCIHGHELTPGNFYLSKTTGQVKCKVCKKAYESKRSLGMSNAAKANKISWNEVRELKQRRLELSERLVRTWSPTIRAELDAVKQQLGVR